MSEVAKELYGFSLVLKDPNPVRSREELFIQSQVGGTFYRVKEIASIRFYECQGISYLDIGMVGKESVSVGNWRTLGMAEMVAREIAEWANDPSQGCVFKIPADAERYKEEEAADE